LSASKKVLEFQIEVKLITATSYPTGDVIDGQLEADDHGDEARQIQHMIYNLMVRKVSIC
jgi:hypothetical protein